MDRDDTVLPCLCFETALEISFIKVDLHLLIFGNPIPGIAHDEKHLYCVVILMRPQCLKVVFGDWDAMLVIVRGLDPDKSGIVLVYEVISQGVSGHLVKESQHQLSGRMRQTPADGVQSGLKLFCLNIPYRYAVQRSGILIR